MLTGARKEALLARATQSPRERTRSAGVSVLLLALVCLGAAAPRPVSAGTPIVADTPLGFFTNVAARLLRSQMGVEFPGIQIYPANYYTPSVHRMLQFAANLYDSTTNRFGPTETLPACPSVFRPLFSTESRGGTNIVRIVGYEEVTNLSQVLGPASGRRWCDLTQPNQIGIVGLRDMVYGMPLIIGAKKGLPNFNEFWMQPNIQVSRKMEFRRNAGNNGPISQTNIMYTLSISNTLGLEVWNSYSNTLPRDVRIFANAQMFCLLTNEWGELLLNYATTPVIRSNILEIPANTWRGFAAWMPAQAAVSFQIPLPPVTTNRFAWLQPSVYRFQSRSFEPFDGTNSLFEANTQFPLPHWFLVLRTRLLFYITDTAGHVLDFVNLDQVEQPLDVSSILTWGGRCGDPGGTFYPDGWDSSMWCTNRLGDPTGLNTNCPTVGMVNQMAIGLDVIPPNNWNSFQPMYYPIDKESAIDFFRAQFDLSPNYAHSPGTYFTKTNRFYAPFVPTREICLKTEWQANDPLVHYTMGDLVDLTYNFQTNRIQFVGGFQTNGLGAINKRYEPYGGSPVSGSYSTTVTNIAVKDSMVAFSDHWDFPANQGLDFAALGRVHRGTPWQTVHLKPQVADSAGWRKWSGNGTYVQNLGQLNTNVVPLGSTIDDAAFTHPTNDWHTATLLFGWVNQRPLSELKSANLATPEEWKSLLHGLKALTNTAPWVSEVTTISSNSPQAALIAAGIQSQRERLPGQRFSNLEQLLLTPELSVASPFLNLTFPRRHPTDADYEALAGQLLPLLRPDSFLSIAGGPFPVRLRCTGLEGQRYALQVSSNLFDWVSVSTNTVEYGSVEFLEPGASAEKAFYRSLLIP